MTINLMRLIFIFVLSSTVYAHVSLAQSCIIVNVTADNLTIGTDSRLTKNEWLTTEGKLDLRTSSEAGCKIRNAGSFFYSPAGEDPAIDSIISITAQENPSYDIFIHVCRYRIQHYLQTLFIGLYNTDSTFISRNITNPVVLEMFMVGFDKKPRATAIWFNLTQRVTIAASFKEIIKNHAALGLFNAFGSEFDGSELWKKPPEAIGYFLKKQIEASPERLAGPIHMLSLSNNGASWSPVDNLCP